MADHPDITDDELVRATKVYLATGSYSAAARAIGRSINGTRDALRRKVPDADRRKVYARALEAALLESADAQREAVRLLRKDLRGAAAKDRPDVAFALNDTAKSLTASRTAHAKLTGEHAPEKHQVNVSQLSDADLDAELQRLAALPSGERAPALAPAGEGTAGDGASQDPGQDPEP